LGESGKWRDGGLGEGVSVNWIETAIETKLKQN
jgi:hypothetical protein